ncbi:lactonase family protein [Lachnospiraceae bacterium ZAX-1]
MKKDKYVAYVGTYTHGTSVGIHIYDIDEEKGAMVERKVVPINNPSHLTVSANGQYLYSIADEGVEAFKILPDGDLQFLNQKKIGGMRGCYVDVDGTNRYLFIAGYHDARVTMMHLDKDGSIGEIADGIFHASVGRSVVIRSSRPHVNCVQLTPGRNRYLCAVDGGLDHVKIYKLDYEEGKLILADVLRTQLDSAPRILRFSADGKFAYLLCELRNCVDVYSYNFTYDGPKFEYIQTVRTMPDAKATSGSASGMEFSQDGKYLYCSNAGADTVIIFEVNQTTGELTEFCSSDISGDYPKTIGIFPDGRHFVSLNHDTNQMTVFVVDLEKKCYLMKGRPIEIDRPNCIYIHKVGKQ